MHQDSPIPVKLSKDQTMQKGRIVVFAALLALLGSSCSLFKGDNCDCPKFSKHQLEAPADIPLEGLALFPTVTSTQDQQRMKP